MMSQDPVPGAAEYARRVMVADAAEESRTRLAAHFRALGYEVRTAADGVEALAQGLAPGADVVVLSLTLPGLDGYEVAAILSRVHPRAQIILTVEAGVEGPPPVSAWTGRFRCFPTPLDFEAVSRALTETAP